MPQAHATGARQSNHAAVRKGRDMIITDVGPQPNAFDIETATTANTHYRAVAWSGKYLQVTLMSIPAGESIGLEMHPETDQFLRLDAGQGRVQMGPARDQLDFEQDVSDGWCVLVPAGTWHNVTNTGEESMRLYTVYAPVHHAPGIIQDTGADAVRDEESGTDEPPSWAIHSSDAEPDRHAD
jgi:mannose-6-phosphate isomerase-like protein (cupin superfamily)